MPIDVRLDKKIWHIYTVEYYGAIKKDEFILLRDIDEAGNHHFQQANIATETQTSHGLTHNWESNSENTWTQGGNNTHWGQLRVRGG